MCARKPTFCIFALLAVLFAATYAHADQPAANQPRVLNTNTVAPAEASPSNDGGKLPRRHNEKKDQAAIRSGAIRTDSVAKNLTGWWPLLVVLGFIAIASLVARRWLPKMQRINVPGGIRVLSRFYLSGKQSLCLIRMGRRVVLLGVTPENIQTLVNVDDPEEAAHLISGLEQTRPGSFAKAFSGVMTKKQPEREEAPDSDDPMITERPLSQSALRITKSVERLRKFAATGSAESI